MNAPVASPNGGPPAPANVMTTINRDELVNALGNAAQRTAEKGAGASDGTQAKDFGAASLAYVQALMLLVAPKSAQTPPQGAGGPQGPPQAAQTGP